LIIGVERVAATVGYQGSERRLGGKHAGFHRRVTALDAGHVDETGRAADQGPARENQLRNRLVAALVDRPRPIADAAAPLEDLPDRRITGMTEKPTGKSFVNR
jgi:hypothetical protein